MNNFVQFLLDYYVWILVVLGVMIITIIGFLVDSKQKRKKKEKEESNIPSEVKTVEPLPETTTQEVAPVMEAKNEPVPAVVDNVIGGNGVYTNPQTVNSAVVQQPAQPIANSNVSTVQNASTQNVNPNLTLGEQKPHFEPREVPMPTQNNMSVNPQVVSPQPVKAVSINQPIANNTMPQQVNPQMVKPVQPAYVNTQNVNQVNSQPVQQMPQNSQNVAQNKVNYANQQPVANPSIPRPVPGVVPTQPVGTIPKAQVTQIPATPVQNVQSVSPAQPVIKPQPTVTTPNIGISFVTGEANENNQNDDTWKL